MDSSALIDLSCHRMVRFSDKSAQLPLMAGYICLHFRFPVHAHSVHVLSLPYFFFLALLACALHWARAIEPLSYESYHQSNYEARIQDILEKIKRHKNCFNEKERSNGEEETNLLHDRLRFCARSKTWRAGLNRLETPAFIETDLSSLWRQQLRALLFGPGRGGESLEILRLTKPLVLGVAAGRKPCKQIRPLDGVTPARTKHSRVQLEQ
ncbi:hypothetical protein RRG08_044746 [Elysia crispata]|uniref:Uncharacterized protein n=1 Tax=Elysia crispata TaxID=231223 RepID=A0AAE0ZIK3_9GAST|nr:hypothetical protein RRG08_044746 [Elysia crispata]